MPISLFLEMDAHTAKTEKLNCGCVIVVPTLGNDGCCPLNTPKER